MVLRGESFLLYTRAGRSQIGAEWGCVARAGGGRFSPRLMLRVKFCCNSGFVMGLFSSAVSLIREA